VTRLFLISLTVAALLAPRPAFSYSLKELLDNRLDPELRYRTLETPHFSIHYPEDLEEVADRLSRVAESAHGRVTTALRSEPQGRTHLVLAHKADQPESFTFVFPHRQIFLDVALPHLGMGMNDFADWYDWLLVHEYAHIVHLDTTAGPARAFSALLGSWLRPNMTLPAWVKEGLAVHIESTLTPKGRGSGSLYRMMARAAVAEGMLESPDNASLDTMGNYGRTEWPWGVRPYLYGALFMKSLAGHSPDALPRFIAGTAQSGPFALEEGLRRAGLPSLEALRSRALEQIRAEASRELEVLRKTPQTRLEYLTHSGFLHYGTNLSPDGRWLIVSRQRPEEDDAIFRFPIEGEQVGPPEVVTTRSSGYQTSFSRSGRFLVFDQMHRARHYLVSDLYIYDLKTKDFASVSPWFRARDPDVHPDGKHLVFVTNEKGRNRLLKSNTAWEEVEDLLGDVGDRRISAPRFSPDGTSVAVMLHDSQKGGEDLVLAGPEGTEVLVADGAQNRTPSWTPDGRYLVFSSDRDGVFNIYALELSTRRLYRLTHTLGGLFYPVVDPSLRWVYATSYGARGYDVVRFRWEPERWTLVWEPPAPEPVGAPEVSPEDWTLHWAPSAPEPADAPEALPDGTLEEVPAELAQATPAGQEPSVSTEYQGWRSLAPQYLVPSILLRPGTYQLGMTLGAVDPLFLQHYELVLRYDLATQLPVGRLFYYDARGPWPLDAVLEHDAVPLGSEARLYRSLGGRASLNIPLGGDQSYTWLRPGLKARRIDYAERTVDVGAELTLISDTEFRQLGYSFAESGSYARVGVEGWWSIARGTPSMAARLSLRTHQPLAWHRHVLHLELEGAAYLLDREAPNSVFSVGGQESFPFSLRSPLLLHGYSPNAIATSQALVATAHYTFPLAEIGRGLGTLPLSFQRTSAAFRLQAAAIDSLRPERLPLSAGVELHQDLMIGDLFGLNAQLGLYQGVPALGGGLQVLFMLTSNEGGGESAAGGERGGRARRH
jgi:Tol biopolymer transport system component